MTTLRPYDSTTYFSTEHLNALVEQAGLSENALNTLVAIQDAVRNGYLIKTKGFAPAEFTKGVAELKKAKMIDTFKNRFHDKSEQGVKITRLGERALVLAGKHTFQSYYDNLNK